MQTHSKRWSGVCNYFNCEIEKPIHCPKVVTFYVCLLLIAYLLLLSFFFSFTIITFAFVRSFLN